MIVAVAFFVEDKEACFVIMLAVIGFGFIGGILRELLLHLGIGGTLLVNLGGSLALGALTPWMQRSRTKPWLSTGVCSGLFGSTTTFSTFISDAQHLLGNSLWQAGLYILFSLCGGMACGFMGLKLTAWIEHRTDATEAIRQR